MRREPTPDELREKRRLYGAYSLGELNAEVTTHPYTYVVEDLLPQATVNLGVGDSSLGKTPFSYQLGICVATGVPFLGRPTKKGRVLYLDLENGSGNANVMQLAITKALGVTVSDEDFTQLPVDVKWQEPNGPLHGAVRDFGASLLIIDTLRAYNPKVTEKNQFAAEEMQKMRHISLKEGCSVLVLHHVRKRPSDPKFELAPLEDAPVMEWMMEASGARALINQSDVRIGFDRPRSVASGVDALNAGLEDEIVMVMKGHEKVRGEFGPIYLKRRYDPDTLEPICYEVVDSLEMLGNVGMISAFKRLSARFTPREAMSAYGMQEAQTRRFLAKCVNLRLIKRVGNRTSPTAHYVKTALHMPPCPQNSPQITCK